MADSADARPRLYLACGTQNFLFPENLRFRDYANALGLEPTYSEEVADQTWDFWDAQIQQVVAWLPLRAAQGDG